MDPHKVTPWGENHEASVNDTSLPLSRVASTVRMVACAAPRVYPLALLH